MKKIIAILVFLSVVISFSGCHFTSSGATLDSGTYYADGDYSEFMTPYLQLDMEENTFSLGMGTLLSYAERGSFMVIGKKLIGKSQNAVFIFEITDSNTLILTHNDLFDELPSDAHFELQ
jgi:hypothetical protein